MTVRRDIFQEIMGTQFKRGAMDNRIIKRAFDHALQALRWEWFQAIRTYWDLNTGQPRMSMEDAAAQLCIARSTLHDRLRRGYICISVQFRWKDISPELRNALRQYQPDD
jgi:hypothetical protein